MSERLANLENRQNYGRGKKSYLEKSFEDWLLKNNISDFVLEKKFRNEELKKLILLTFVLKKKN